MTDADGIDYGPMLEQCDDPPWGFLTTNKGTIVFDDLGEFLRFIESIHATYLESARTQRQNRDGTDGRRRGKAT